jgi:hypothetical protein
MRRLRDPKWILIFFFLGIIAAVPLIQTMIEAGGDEGVIALEVFSAPPTAANLRSYEKKLEAAGWVGRFSRPLVQFAQFKWLNYGGEKAIVGPQGWYFFKPGLNYMLARPEIARAANATNDPVAAIVDFRDQLAARGIDLLVMPVPNKDSIYPDRLTSRAKNMEPLMAPRTRQLLERLNAAGVEVVDLFKEFSPTRQSGSNSVTPLYLAQDTHWSPAGVTLATRAAARRLTELRWVRLGNVNYGERPAPVQRLGDIVHMLQAPKIERMLTPEKISCVQVVRGQEGQLYKDDPNAEILVLGDSFMRIYQENTPTAAGFIAHLARELKQPLLSLVNDGGGSTIVREELCARPIYLKNKKVVLWEFVERDIGIGIKGWQRTPLPPASPTAPISADDRLTSKNIEQP